MDTETRGDLFQFATRSVCAPASQQAVEEALSTIAELIESFGEDVVIGALQQTKLSGRLAVSDDRLYEALRAFSIIIQESRWPKLDGMLVGRLVKMEIATGKRLKMDDLGRMFGGQSKQAISKRQRDLAQRLGLENPDSSPQARESHRMMNRRNVAL